MATAPGNHDAIVSGRAVMGSSGGACKAHVDPDCPFYPGKPKPVSEDDRRRVQMRMCSWCRTNSEREYHPEIEVQ